VSMASHRGVGGAVPFRHISSTFPVAAKRGNRRTEPDLDLIKQVEQVATLVLEGPARRSARFGARGSRSGSDPHISNLPIISLADISLQKTAKTASVQIHSDDSADAPSSLSRRKPGSISAVNTGFRR
jgi:hypothetical protein